MKKRNNKLYEEAFKGIIMLSMVLESLINNEQGDLYEGIKSYAA